MPPHVRVAGLGYAAEYFTFDELEVVHAAVTHVDHQVRAVAPVWLPHIAPTPLCGLGRPGSVRHRTRPFAGPLCRACADHLRELDDWVREAEKRLEAIAADDVTPVERTDRAHAMHR